MTLKNAKGRSLLPTGEDLHSSHPIRTSSFLLGKLVANGRVPDGHLGLDSHLVPSIHDVNLDVANLPAEGEKRKMQL